MSFKAKVSIDANGVKEERSVLFIQILLLGRTKNYIDKGTTAFIEVVGECFSSLSCVLKIFSITCHRTN